MYSHKLIKVKKSKHSKHSKNTKNALKTNLRSLRNKTKTKTKNAKMHKSKKHIVLYGGANANQRYLREYVHYVIRVFKYIVFLEKPHIILHEEGDDIIVATLAREMKAFVNKYQNRDKANITVFLENDPTLYNYARALLDNRIVNNFVNDAFTYLNDHLVGFGDGLQHDDYMIDENKAYLTSRINDILPHIN